MISSANSASIHALIQIKMDMPEPPSRLPSASLGPHIPVDFDPTSSISTTQISASRKRRSTHAMSSEDRRKFRRVHDISTHKEGYTPCPSSSLQKPKCKIIRMSDGTILESRPIEACPDVPTLGDEPKRDETGSTIPNTKNEAEAKSELKWQKARKQALDERFFTRLNLHEDARKTDWRGVFYFEDLSLPSWLKAVREIQDDGRPGTFVFRPNQKDFETRLPEIMKLIEPIGMKLGVLKIEIPKESIMPSVPYSEFMAQDTQNHSEKDDSIPKYKMKPSISEPRVFSMEQYLPLHLNSVHRHAPIFEVISRRKKEIPISKYEHKLTDESPNHRIPEEVMLNRGRTWHDIINENPGGEVYYSSDNEVDDKLRSYLGLGDPNLDKLSGNLLFDSHQHVIGIHTPYLYLGNPYTLFALHQEDYCALSLNFHHKGAPKMWRVTCPFDFDKVESLIARTEGLLNGEYMCSQKVRHSSVFVSEGAFELAGVRSILVRQKPGEMIVTWPLAYHQGWNEGANVCEAIAYGTESWKMGFIKGGEMVYRACGKKCLGTKGIPITLDFDSDDGDRHF